MPFRPPWVTSFEAGDLVYGRHKEDGTGRSRFIAQLEPQRSAALGGRRTVILDQFSRSYLPKYTGKDLQAYEDFMTGIARHPSYYRYRQAVDPYKGDDQAFSGKASDFQWNRAIRAKSKFGLQHTIESGRGRIHFVLDELNMYQVATKSNRADLPAGKAPTRMREVKERAITASELRWLYRYRNDPRIARAVQFWRSNGDGRLEPTRPPWENTLEQTRSGSGRSMTWADAWSLYYPIRGDRRL